jgi:hypothetical protein
MAVWGLAGCLAGEAYRKCCDHHPFVTNMLTCVTVENCYCAGAWLCGALQAAWQGKHIANVVK